MVEERHRPVGILYSIMEESWKPVDLCPIPLQHRGDHWGTNGLVSGFLYSQETCPFVSR